MADPNDIIEMYKQLAMQQAQQPQQAPNPQVAQMQGQAPGIGASQPQVTQVQQKPGPVSSFLSSFIHGAGQGLLAHVGLPTDDQKQQVAFQQAQAVGAANRAQALQQAQIQNFQSQADQRNQDNELVDISTIVPGMTGMVARKDIPKALVAHIAGLSRQNVATTNAGARTDAAQIGADARTSAAQINADVRDLVSQRQYGVAAQHLKLAGSNLGLRQLEYNLRAYGTGADGNPVPGVTFDQDGRPIGTAMAPNSRPTSAARNAGERGETMQDIEARIRGALNDPSIASQLGPVQGRINELKNQAGLLDGPTAELYNDLKSYGAFQAGLHPVRGIGGLQYFDKVMGGLGQTPEELLGKLNSNRATSNSVIGVARTGTAGGARSSTPVAAPPSGGAGFFGQFGGSAKKP